MGVPEFLIIAAIAVGVFLLFRNINLWYFKINESIKLQQEQVDLLKKLIDKTGNNI